jgi:hypothetical protein
MFERVHALTSSTQFPNHELGSSTMFLEPRARPSRKRDYYGLVAAQRDRPAELAFIAILVAGFIIAALFALDLLDTLRW